MNVPKLASTDAVLLVRSLGLLISQAGIYGIRHNVTRQAARSVFVELERLLTTYRQIEIDCHEHQLLVNGAEERVDPTTAKNLVERMEAHKVGGIEFLSPPDMDEFLACIALFAAQPNTLAAEGGFEEGLKRANVRSIKTVQVSYRRADEEEQPRANASRSSAVGVLDLSAVLSQPGEGGEGDNAWGGMGADVPSVPKKKGAFKEQTAMLAAFLRETAELLESQLSQHELHVKIALVLDKIRAALEEFTEESQEHISSLADQVDADKLKIDSLESAARRRGIGLKLSRHELIERYAELNQEMIQPLTVSSGILDLLTSGKVGELSQSQQDLLKVASESVARVNQLVSYMSRVTGLPQSFTPDAEVIRDSYR
ncbi:MAG: hypothetical protein J6Z49_09070 [Kiritimatiellae bacterium]|nr:hypothetical protein [Kiritimatiellia bacterium]